MQEDIKDQKVSRDYIKEHSRDEYVNEVIGVPDSEFSQLAKVVNEDIRDKSPAQIFDEVLDIDPNKDGAKQVWDSFHGTETYGEMLALLMSQQGKQSITKVDATKVFATTKALFAKLKAGLGPLGL